MAALTALFDASRLATLTGPPGIGKTRLAVEFTGARWESTREEAMWFVEVAGLDDPAHSSDVIAAALGWGATATTGATPSSPPSVDDPC